MLFKVWKDRWVLTSYRDTLCCNLFGMQVLRGHWENMQVRVENISWFFYISIEHDVPSAWKYFFLKQKQPTVLRLCAVGYGLVFRNEIKLSFGKKSWTIIFAEFGKVCLPLTGRFFNNTDINFLHTLAMALEKFIFCDAGVNYYCLYLLIFIVLCKCKDCVLFARLMFHNELANFASARLLLIAAIYFVNTVAQLLKPYLVALLHLTSCLLRWSCAWVKRLNRLAVWRLYAIRNSLIRNQMHP